MMAAVVPRPPSKGSKYQIKATATKIDNCKSGGYTTISLRGSNNNDIEGKRGGNAAATAAARKLGQEQFGESNRST
jgi:hypothetical protein